MIVVPLVVIAVAMSFIVPVQPWVVVLAVLAGLPIQWRLWPTLMGFFGFAVSVGAAAWVVGAFVAALAYATSAVAERFRSSPASIPNVKWPPEGIRGPFVWAGFARPSPIPLPRLPATP